MHKEKIFTIVVSSFLALMLSSLPLAFVTRAQVVVGVNVGDWIKYGDILAEWNSTQLNPDSEFVERNNTLWFKNEVVDIVDTHIVFNQTTYFINETQEVSVFTVDIYTGEGSGSLMFIPSGLDRDYYIYPATTDLGWINETTTRTYAGVAREVNQLTTTTEFTLDDPPNVIHTTGSYFWDRTTGVLTERLGFGTINDQTGSQIASWSMSDKIVETNLWSPGASQFPYEIAGVVIVALILIVIWSLWPRKRGLKKSKSRIRRQTQ